MLPHLPPTRCLGPQVTHVLCVRRRSAITLTHVYIISLHYQVDPTVEVRATLVWMDPPVLNFVGRQLLHDLDLVVVPSAGEESEHFAWTQLLQRPHATTTPRPFVGTCHFFRFCQNRIAGTARTNHYAPASIYCKAMTNSKFLPLSNSEDVSLSAKCYIAFGQTTLARALNHDASLDSCVFTYRLYTPHNVLQHCILYTTVLPARIYL